MIVFQQAGGKGAMKQDDWQRPAEATGMYPMEIAALAAQAGFAWLSTDEYDGMTSLGVEAPFGRMFLVLGSRDQYGSYHFLYARVVVFVADAAAVAARLRQTDPHGPFPQAPQPDALSLMRLFIMDHQETPAELPGWLVRVAGEFAMALRLVQSWQQAPPGG